MPENNTQALTDAIDNIMGHHADIDVSKQGIKDLMAGLKEKGYDLAAVRRIVTRKKKDRDAVLEADETMLAYEASMGLKMPSW